MQQKDEVNEAFREIYFAGGCFWGVEELMRSVQGVVDAVSGYANGRSGPAPSYEEVCSGRTGFSETVRVVYDPARVSLSGLVFLFFRAIDPTDSGGQGNDRGTQYRSGIYYTDEESAVVVRRAADVERRRHSAFYVEILPLLNFYPAEEFHQRYLEKHQGGYCHIPRELFSYAGSMRVDPELYPRPSDAEISRRLSSQEFSVTQEGATDLPHSHPLTTEVRRGLYVDAVTGEPLFSSRDKYQSSCGWPAFSEPVDGNTMVFSEDRSHGMRRTEVRSRAGDSHLGHVFGGDEESPSGVRFCINGSSLRFVPYEKMEEEGYGELMDLV
ncbi:peptide-methionine (S)-S-oxide reductase MsrA [Methanorbis furvi]|uniref:Peptide methionine sulfoxide reductase MsrA n=1 Tax=Methanorbis furvi TaxID=3028299 RepID=A0AAE4MDU7_9EURY|nr:Peptide methionine sulfoxide reductase MsrA/MsrB [Methanocorpusculaceae archaeon Ag1]